MKTDGPYDYGTPPAAYAIGIFFALVVWIIVMYFMAWVLGHV